ncbi:hypothetical protein EYC55_03205 [Xanthomonas oryzae]|nr:hypothetical protein BRN32_02920 [Xanthomonas oryzae pv. oryzae]QBG94687.1 hypothetical protein EYC55_03205 [Xanthomonas oryzae]RBH29576.1 hypothetical protein BRM00_16910 [Xanthomonas oryzae pv. oryzae]RBH94333.1 hypothetical protein BRL93_03275 [Xanthomonas oryzae pv. oryzae]RBI21782.1 hypothetical protein BRL87_04070 [Xanthomonas oryzae pv. oryzae]
MVQDPIAPLAMLTSALSEDALRQSVGELSMRSTRRRRCLDTCCAPAPTTAANCTAGSCMTHGGRWVRSCCLRCIRRAGLVGPGPLF